MITRRSKAADGRSRPLPEEPHPRTHLKGCWWSGLSRPPGRSPRDHSEAHRPQLLTTSPIWDLGDMAALELGSTPCDERPLGVGFAVVGTVGTPRREGQELHEFYCPGCWSLLEVEAVPPGYPAVFDFEPDIDTFYADFLGRPAPAAG